MMRPCGDCRHFLRDALNPAQGVGDCAVQAPAFQRGLPYPGVRRECQAFVER